MSGIQRLHAVAKGLGLESHDGQWSKAFVHWFDRPMPSEVEEAGREEGLAYFDEPATPHLPAHHGYIDLDRKISVTFLRGNERAK